MSLIPGAGYIQEEAGVSGLIPGAGYVGELLADASVSVTLTAGILSLTGNDPIVDQGGYGVVLTAGALSLTENSPNIHNGNDVVDHSAGVLTLNGNQPIISVVAHPEQISYIDSQCDLYAYINEGFKLLSGSYNLNANIQYNYYLDAQYDSLSYDEKNVSVDGKYGIYSYEDIQYGLIGQYDYYSYKSAESSSQGKYDVFIYKPSQVDINGQFNLNSYSAQLFGLTAQNNLYSYQSNQSALHGQQDLLSYQSFNSGIDAQYDIYRYVAVTAYVDGQQDLLAYQTFIVPLHGQYDLNAYTQVVSYLQAEYNILANEAFYGWIINLDTKAVSRYEGFDFNSLDGQFGAMSDGIYQLSGTTNNGTAINAFIQTGRFDFGTPFKKRVQYAYLAASSSGDLQLSMTANGDTNDYTVTPETEVNTVKAKLGLGPYDRYWQAKVSNVDGSDFELYSTEFLEAVQSRRHK
jgi:hypothetical protein